MGVALPPLEFTECLSDSPYFRENLRKHERELEKTNQQIKRIIKEVKDLLAAAKQLSSVQKSFAESLKNFSFECIGGNQTDDEQIICSSLRNLSDLIAQVEEERNRMLESASISVVKPLEDFRKKYIGGVKEEKKKFEKQTAKFCHNQERYLNLTTKKTTTSLQEADASVDMAERCFYAASMDYVCLIQEIHERKKFQFVEVLLTFVYSWFTFYHQGYEVKKDFEPYMKDLQQKIQKTRSNFTDFSAKLKKRMSEVQKQEEPLRHLKGKEGYLYLLEKKAFGTTWTKHYCKYDKESKIFTMLPYNQLTTKTLPQPEAMTLTSCIRRMSESIEKRFCFDIQSDSKPGVVYTFQALSEQDRKAWIDIMDGKEPTYTVPVINKPLNNTEEKYQLDDTGMNFVKKCIEVLESRGLEEQGIYRVVGVTSKVNKLLVMGLDRRKNEKLALEDPQEWETKTITSALKNYLRNLPEPLMTYKYHNSFIAAVKNESRELRVNEVHSLVYRIPKVNFDILKMIIKHLTKVSSKSDKNLMNVSNLGVCFGPTLLRPEEETVASIMDLKFYNIVVEILIENYDKIFYSEPGRSPPKPALSKNLNGPSQKYNTGHLQPNNHLPTYIDREQDQRYNVGTTYGKINSYKIGENQAYTCNVNPYYEAPITSSMFNVHDTLELNDANNVYAMSRSEHRPTFQSRYKLKPTSVSHSETNISNLQSYSPTGFRNYAQLEPHSTSSSNESLSSTSRDGNNFNGATPKKTERSSLYLSYPKGYKSPGNMTLINKPGSLANVTPPRSLSPTNSRVRRVRTLYACLGEHDGELSFEPNQIITNVKTSQEPGWLEGTLNGKTGLIPENYVEVLP